MIINIFAETFEVGINSKLFSKKLDIAKLVTNYKPNNNKRADFRFKHFFEFGDFDISFYNIVRTIGNKNNPSYEPILPSNRYRLSSYYVTYSI